MKAFLTAVLSVMSCLWVSANPLSDADSAYNRGDFGRAIEIYSAVEKSDGYSAPMLYNMGNAYYKDGDEGKAMVCYKRARRLDPCNDRINENIRFLASKIEDINKAQLKGKKGNVAPDPVGFFSRVGSGITAGFPANYWGLMGAMAFVLLLGAVAVYLFSPTVRLKKIGFFSGIIMFFFSVVFVAFAFAAAARFESHDEAVLTGFKTTLLEEPSDNSRKIGYPLHRGTVLQIVETENGVDGSPAWYKVKLNSDNIGWVEASALEIV